MCKKDDEALRLLREVVTNSPGRPEEGEKNSDNITNKDSRGTRKDYTLDRLAREDPAQWHAFLRDGTASMPYNPASTELNGVCPE